MPVDLLADRKLESGPARVGESPSESIRSENALGLRTAADIRAIQQQRKSADPRTKPQGSRGKTLTF
jgi:hypothetical protein